MLITWWAWSLFTLEWFVKPEYLIPPDPPASPKAGREDAPLRYPEDKEESHECEVDL